MDDLPLGAAGVGAHDDGVLAGEVLADPAQDAGLGVEVVDGDVEEALDLGGVEVHGDDVVAAGRLQHVGDELGRDGRAALVLLVLPRVGEVGDHGRDAPRRGRAAGVDHDEQLHKSVIDVAWRRRLQDEDWKRGEAITLAQDAKPKDRMWKFLYHLRPELIRPPSRWSPGLNNSNSSSWRSQCRAY